MTAPMTDPSTQIAAIKARLEAATSGEWLVDPEGWETEEGMSFLTIYGGGIHGSSAEHCVANVSNYGQGVMACEADAQLIAHAPTDIRWLLDEVERLTRLLDD